MVEESLLLVPLQHLDRSAGSHRFVEGGHVRAMQKDRIDAIDTEQVETTLEPALDRFAAEIAVTGRATDFGLEYCALREPTDFLQRQTDTPLALAIAIPGGGIDVIDRARQRRFYRGDRICRGDGIAEGIAHIPQRSAANRNRGHLQRRRAA